MEIKIKYSSRIFLRSKKEDAAFFSFSQGVLPTDQEKIFPKNNISIPYI